MGNGCCAVCSGLWMAGKMESVREAWENGISTYYVNSLLVTAAAVILILILSTLAAFALTRLDMKFKKIIFILLIGAVGYSMLLITERDPTEDDEQERYLAELKRGKRK